MAKRSNNSLGRRSYGGKPYDANNSFVKKMATKVTDLIPQRSWISKWFNASQDNGESTNDDDNFVEREDETHQPPAKRPRIRMDITHPPGTFSIRARDKDSSNNRDTRIPNETDEYFLEPAVAGPSGVCKFVSSTPAVNADVRNSNSQISRAVSSHVTTGNNVGSNGADDNSESGESTSGCSSLIPQTNRQEGAPNSAYGSNPSRRNRFVDDKSSFANHLQSARSLFLENGGINRESLSSRRPSFNPSMLNNSGNNFERSSSLSSPFYSGNVTFGGANALGNYKRSRSLFSGTNDFQLKIPRRTSVQVKPSSVESIDATGMSQTAKRILEAMEYFSSPITDAKKIPIKQQAEVTSVGKKRSRDDGISSSSSSLSTTRVGLRHLTRELAVPTVPEMLKLRRRQKLQDTTVAARKIISAMSGPAPSSSWPTTTTTEATTRTRTTTTTTTMMMTTTPTTETTIITAAPRAAITASVASHDYHLRTELDQSPKYHGKLRGKSKKNNPDDEGPAPSVNLPSISLAITSLPSFEPLPKYTVSTIASSVSNDNNELDSNTCDYKFASPINITEASWNLKSINNFIFSKPINASESTKTPVNDNLSRMSAVDDIKTTTSDCRDDGAVAKNFVYTSSSTAPRLKVKTKRSCEIVVDKEKCKNFDSSETIKMTKLKDKAKSTDTSVSRSTKSELGLNFMIWECSECYIKNDCSEKTCTACKTSNPREIVKDSFVSRANSIDNVETKKTPRIGKNHSNDMDFGSKFRMSVNQWECESCMVRNAMTNKKCLSCSASKPSVKKTRRMVDSPTLAKTPSRYDLAEKFKPAEGSWECSGCMLRNPSSVITCPCCSASKPSPARESPKTMCFDETASAKSTKKNVGEFGLMDKFKPAAGTWECTGCLVRNNDTAVSCVCCSAQKPGVAMKIGQEPGAAATPRVNVEAGWGEKFKKPEGSWSCESCMLQNKCEANECVACNTAKPGTVATKTQDATTSKFSFGIPNFGINDQSFEFGIKKSDGTSKWADSCVDFTNGFDYGVSSAATHVEPGKFTFGIPKDTEKMAETTKSLANSSGGFVFASPKTAKEGEPKFATRSNKDTASETCDDKNNDSMKFLFGMPKSVNKKRSLVEDSTREETEAFPRINNNSGKAQFSFGMPKSDDNTTSDSKTGFRSSNSEKSFIFGGNSRRGAINELNNLKSIKSSTITSEEQSEKSLSSSVTSPSTNISAQARTSFAFTEPKSKIATQISSIAPNFGQTPVATSTSSFSIIGNSSGRETNLESTEKSNDKPLASNFGIHNSITPLTSFPNIPTSSSASPVVDTLKSTFFGITGEKKPSPPSFGATIEKKSQIFGNTENKLSTGFGTGDKPLAGNTIFSSAVAASSTSFGGNSMGSSQTIFGNSSTSVFGGNTANPSFASGSGNVGASNIFGAAGKSNVSSAPASSQGLFSFGGANTQQITGQSTPGTFSFVTDTGDSASSATKPIFSFGNAAGASQPSASECFGGSGGGAVATAAGTNTVAFGAPASNVTNPSSSPFTFNAPSTKQEQLAFGQTSSTIPSIFGAQPVSSGMGQQQAQNSSTFGTSAPASSTGFTFGANAPSAVSGGFNFGGGMTQQPAAPPSSGFNFNASSPSPAIAFDPNTRPSFNFTGGTAPTAFNAPQPVATRKIKKAVRRMQQR